MKEPGRSHIPPEKSSREMPCVSRTSELCLDLSRYSRVLCPSAIEFNSCMLDLLKLLHRPSLVRRRNERTDQRTHAAGRTERVLRAGEINYRSSISCCYSACHWNMKPPLVLGGGGLKNVDAVRHRTGRRFRDTQKMSSSVSGQPILFSIRSVWLMIGFGNHGLYCVFFGLRR